MDNSANAEIQTVHACSDDMTSDIMTYPGILWVLYCVGQVFKIFGEEPEHSASIAVGKNAGTATSGR